MSQLGYVLLNSGSNNNERVTRVANNDLRTITKTMRFK